MGPNVNDGGAQHADAPTIGVSPLNSKRTAFYRLLNHDLQDIFFTFRNRSHVRFLCVSLRSPLQWGKWSLTRFMIGQLINGRYRIDAFVGQGGMGNVYLAHDRLSNETIALKQVAFSPNLRQLTPTALATKTTQQLHLALAREFQILASLRHPHIISVLDYGFDQQQRPFFTMTYLQEAANGIGRRA